MRLLFVCKSLPFSYKGGIQTHVWELTQELIAAGHEITILTAGSWRNGTEIIYKEGRTLIQLPYLPGRKVPFFRKTLEDVCFNVAAHTWVKNHEADYDRIHLQGRSGCFYAASDRDVSSTPVVSTFHRLLEVEYEYDGQRTGKLDGFFHQLIMGYAERAAARKSDHVIAVSKEMKRELITYIGGDLSPISILPNGVSRHFGDPVVDKERWQLVFVGRLETIKGVFVLLKALPLMDKRIDLVFIGDGPERKALETLSKKLGLRLRVKFLGNQDSESVRYWIQRSFALVLPSFHESQGIVLLEAGVCGRPVIAAQAPGINEMVDHGYNGLLFPVGDASSLAVSINHVFHNPALATRLGKAGRLRATVYYDWAGIAAQTAEVYRGIGIQQAGEREVPTVNAMGNVRPRVSLPDMKIAI
ncbi:MAG: glycosyltransferase family 4 protein [Saprospiraceae bacterium]